MKRRDVIAGLGSAAVAWPLAARAQPALPVIGFLNGSSPSAHARNLQAFLEGLGETGYVEGRNVIIEYRWADGHYDRLPGMAADLVRRQVTVIAATSTPAAVVAKAAITTIPIVFTTGADPVQLGLVASLSRPGGNVTGATQMTVETDPKRLELAHELVPTATVIALLVNPTGPVAELIARDMLAAADTLGLQIHVLRASNEREIEDAFAASIKLGAGALVIGAADSFLLSRVEQLGALTLRYKMPTIFQYHEFVAAGGLMSYSSSLTNTYHQAGVYTGRILKGEKPADLPVVRATKFELLINLKTAKTLGLTVPQSMLVSAEEVIE
jgi:putative ABC transport system substrate-binding protein